MVSDARSQRPWVGSLKFEEREQLFDVVVDVSHERPLACAKRAS